MDQRAEELCKKKYSTIIQLEQDTDGNEIYSAVHPELPGCSSQGETPEEAEANLADATCMVIEYLLETGQPIPEPQTFPARVFTGPPDTSESEEGLRLTAPGFQWAPAAHVP